jgi:hypothetical protein
LCISLIRINCIKTRKERYVERKNLYLIDILIGINLEDYMLNLWNHLSMERLNDYLDHEIFFLLMHLILINNQNLICVQVAIVWLIQQYRYVFDNMFHNDVQHDKQVNVILLVMLLLLLQLMIHYYDLIDDVFLLMSMEWIHYLHVMLV